MKTAIFPTKLIAYDLSRRFRDKDARYSLGESLDPACEVHRIADRGVIEPIGRADAADHRAAGVDADADIEAGAETAELAAQLLQRIGHLQRCRDRPGGMIGISGGRPPEGHDRIADELVERAAMAED